VHCYVEAVPDHSACDVCSRTILKGEQVHEYVTPQGESRGVCVLCRQRAEASGWIPAEQYGAIEQEPVNRPRRGQALRERLGRAASRARVGARPARASAGRDDAKPAKEEDGGEATTTQTVERERPEPDRRAERPKPTPATLPAPKAAPRPRRGPEAIMRSAVERFNQSHDHRKVAGLIRSLGEPQAAVVADAGRQLALVTVAWELSWYQWEVNGEDDDLVEGTVREVAKGDEVSELAEEARTWNAAVAEDGTLRLRSSDRDAAPAGEA
jgi:hypothetical protein